MNGRSKSVVMTFVVALAFVWFDVDRGKPGFDGSDREVYMRGTVGLYDSPGDDTFAPKVQRKRFLLGVGDGFALPDMRVRASGASARPNAQGMDAETEVIEVARRGGAGVQGIIIGGWETLERGAHGYVGGASAPDTGCGDSFYDSPGDDTFIGKNVAHRAINRWQDVTLRVNAANRLDFSPNGFDSPVDDALGAGNLPVQQIIGILIAL